MTVYLSLQQGELRYEFMELMNVISASGNRHKNIMHATLP